MVKRRMNEELKRHNSRLKKEDKIVLLLYSLYIVLSPFYFWSSGLPQLSDLLLLVCIFLNLIISQFSITINNDSKKFIVTIILFVYWIIVTNLKSMLFLEPSKDFVVASIFYFYNFMVCLNTIFMGYKYKSLFLEVILNSLVVSLVLQIFIFFSKGFSSGARQMGTFNNPNQLGYYMLLVLCILIFLKTKIHISFPKFMLSIVIALFFVFSSLSNGAIISSVLLIFLYASQKNIKVFLYSVVSPMLVYITIVKTGYLIDNPFYQSLVNRMSNTGEKVMESSMGRGYFRIFDYPEYWLLGSGEGVNERFGQSIEFHSTLGNIQVSYGIVGSILFLLLLYIILKKNNFDYWYIILAIMLYGFSHNGIRNRLLWGLLGLMISYSSLKNIEFRKSLLNKLKNKEK